MLFSPSETEQVTPKTRPEQAQNQKRRSKMNPLQELLKKKLAEPTTKRQYFRNNQKTVIELLNAGATHAEILQAFELDGVTMSARYFSRLLNDASPKERPESKPVESKSHRAGLGASPKPVQEKTDSNLTPLEQSIKDEVDKIKASDMSPSQKREALAKATAPLKNRNPLAARR